MRVLVVGLNYAPEPTGIAPYTAAFCQGLVHRGHQVRVLTTKPHYPEWRVQEGYEGWRSTERVNGVSVTRVSHYVPAKPSGFRRLLSEVTFGIRAALCAWGRPDVVVLVSPALFSTGIAMWRARASGRPPVVWVQDVYSLGVVETQGESSGGIVARIVTATESSVLRRAAGVGVIHKRFAGVVERLGADTGSITIIRNWTHLPERKAASREKVRRRLGWLPDQVVVLHSGAMGKKQDLDNVIEAARAAHDRSAPVRFVLMGNGGERARLEELAGDLSTVTFLHPLPGDEFQDALAAADVLLVNEHAGLREMAVPSKLTSYFSSGRPVVAATDADSVTAEEMTASEGGVRVEPGQPEALLDAVLRIGQDTAWADQLGSAGRAYQRAVLSEDAALNHYTAWLEQIAAQHERPSAWRRVSTLFAPPVRTSPKAASD